MTSTNSTNKPRLFVRDGVAILACLLLLVFPWVAGSLDPHLEHAQSLCPFKMLTGFPCPGCGITKSVYFLYRGDIEASIAAHAFGIPAVLFALAYPLYLLAGKPFVLPPRLRTQAGYTLATLFALYHLVRLSHFVITHSLPEIIRESVWA